MKFCNNLITGQELKSQTGASPSYTVGDVTNRCIEERVADRAEIGSSELNSMKKSCFFSTHRQHKEINGVNVIIFIICIKMYNLCNNRCIIITESRR